MDGRLDCIRTSQDVNSDTADRGSQVGSRKYAYGECNIFIRQVVLQ